MPGTRRIWPRHQKRQSMADYPMSYVKICRRLELVVLGLAVVCLNLTGTWSRCPVWLLLLCLSVGIVLLSVILEKFVWLVLPSRLRDRIPYDARDALSSCSRKAY